MYRVMQITETGEEFCQLEKHHESECSDWIRDNSENFPESDFYIECDNEESLCSACNGSGEGMHDGSRCHECRGRGTV